MLSNLYTYKNEYNSTIKVYYLNNIEDTVNIKHLSIVISDIYLNIAKTSGNLFDKMIIEIWNTNRSDVPITKQVCEADKCYTKLGIANYGGLTTSQINLIQLNHSSIDTLEKMSHCLSHEFGHYKAYKMGFNSLDNFNKTLTNYYKNKVFAIMVKNNEPNISYDELIAENIRKFDGSRLTNNVDRGSATYIETGNNSHIKSLLKIWHPVINYINIVKLLPFTSIDNFVVSEVEKELEITFTVKYCFFFSKKLKFNSFGVYELNSTVYKLIRQF